MKETTINAFNFDPAVFQENWELGKSYFNWEKIKTEVPWPIRYSIMANDTSHYAKDDEYRKKIQSYNISPIYEEARKRAAHAVIDFVNQNYASFTDFRDRVNLDEITALSHMAKRHRPFSMSLANTEKTLDAMGISFHQLLFGEQGVAILPNTCSALINMLEQIPERKAAAVAAGMAQEIKTLLWSGNYISPNYQRIVAERILSYARDAGVYPRRLIGDTPPPTIRNLFNTIAAGDSPKEIRLEPLMTIAFETGQAIDYFLIPRYGEKVPLYYRDSDGELKELKSPKEAGEGVTSFNYKDAIIALEMLYEKDKLDVLSKTYAKLLSVAPRK